MLKDLVAACYFFVALVLGPACSGSPSTQTTTARLTAASSSSMCLDVLDYGATCNDGLDDRVATQTWLDAQSPLTPGCDLPPCTLSYARNPEPGTQHIPSIRVRGTGKRFWGAGKNATTIEMIGGSGRDWTLVDVTGEGHVVGNFTATGANRGLTESEQTHLIQLTGPASDIDVLDAELHLPQQAGNHGGDCIRMLGNEPLGQEPKLVNGVTIERVFAPECDRSFVGFQRGTYNVWIANVISIIVGDAAFDFEPTGQGEIGWITVRDSQAYTGHGGRFATPAGNNTFAHDILFERVATDGGGFFLYRVARATFRDMTIVMTATAPDHTPFAAIKEGAGIKIDGGLYERSGVAGPVLSFAMHAGSYPTDVTIGGGVRVVQHTAAPAIKASPIIGLDVDGANIVCDAPTANVEAAVLVENVQAISRAVKVRGSRITGNCRFGLQVGASPDVVFTGNVAEVGLAAVRFNSTPPKQPVVDGNSVTSTTLGTAPLAVSPSTQAFVGSNSL